MQFQGIRCLIWILALMGYFFFIKNSKRLTPQSKIYIFLLICIICSVVSLVPFERPLIVFPTLEEAYSYLGQGEIVMVVPGRDVDLVLVNETGKEYLHMIPKADAGWTVAADGNVQFVRMGLEENISYCIYRYRDTDDYFLSVLFTPGGTAEISDNCNSTFYPISQENAITDQPFYTYYASVYALDETYSLTVNGIEIPLGIS